MLNDDGELVEFVGTTMEVTEQVQAREQLERAFAEIRILKDQLQQENVALREEVDRVSMFEEIVGTSRALQAVLSRVIKVAPTDSTVLSPERPARERSWSRGLYISGRRERNARLSASTAPHWRLR